MSHENKTLELANNLCKNIFRYAITLAVALTTSAVITATSFAACACSSVLPVHTHAPARADDTRRLPTPPAAAPAAPPTSHEPLEVSCL